MKINEIINEGILGAIGKGIGAGLGMNPGSTADQYQRTDHLDNKAQKEKNKEYARANPKPEHEPKATWNYKNKVLTIDGHDFKRTVSKKDNSVGWYDLPADRNVIPSGVPELNNYLSIAQGYGPLKADPVPTPVTPSEPVPTPVTPSEPVAEPVKKEIPQPTGKKLGTVQAKGLTLSKFNNGHWYDTANGEIVINQNDIGQLDRLLAAQPKPRTGGKVPGQVSQTPNAQRKRAARQPQVFSSNRRA